MSLVHTSCPGHATEMTQHLDLGEVDLLVVVGGDGTVWEALQVGEGVLMCAMEVCYGGGWEVWRGRKGLERGEEGGGGERGKRGIGRGGGDMEVVNRQRDGNRDGQRHWRQRKREVEGDGMGISAPSSGNLV